MQTTFQASTSARITVVGDVLLDRYVYGETHRISPEAPVPVIQVQGEEERAGGAANVALNISHLGVKVKLVGVTGNDDSADRLEAMLTQQGVCCDLLRQDNFPTITKIRILSQNQQLLRMDYEERPHKADGEALMDRCLPVLEQTDLLVLSDYAKGSLNRVADMIKAARERHIPTVVDPKGTDFSRYVGASVLTPNVKEFAAVVGGCETLDELVEKGQQLCQECDIGTLLVTRGAQGMTLVDKQRGLVCHLPAMRHEVFDVTGAGDTVIATYAAAMASAYHAEQAVNFANHAAGIVVGKIGTASITAVELNSAMHDYSDMSKTAMTEFVLHELVSQARTAGEKIVFTNGCFDILHAGHVACLEQAKSFGHRLIVGLNDDASVRRLKGAARPVNSVENRIKVLSALAVVDWVIPFGEDTPAELIRLLKPDVLVKGGDYAVDELVGAEFVLRHGGEVKIIELQPGLSTTAIMNRTNVEANP